MFYILVLFCMFCFLIGDKGREGGQQNSREFDPLQNSSDKEKHNSDDKGKGNLKNMVFRIKLMVIIYRFLLILTKN